ncbi:hypothetical protein SLS64_012741 [Diaporthe eres]|uniref:Oligopeptide transporter n=1 Tax=Diaporthe eres TaxID=83184 RepID=A0ABR1NPZ6_DIAER
MDLFKPLPPLEGSTVEKELNPLTIRSVVLGLVFGSLVSASNVYLGLKTGFVFSANMFGAIFGFGVTRFLSQTLGHVPVLGNKGVFGPSENNMIQATASGADGLSGFFVAAVPAMYRLSLLSDPEGANPVLRDFGKLTNGVTDINPTTAAAKASQLVFGGVTSAEGLPPEKALSANIIAGAMAAGAADMSNTIISNYRTGFLLKTPLKPQFWAQAAGAIVSVFLAPGIFMLFVQAYPCVIQKDADRCAFPAPSVAAWVAVAQAVTMRHVPIPRSSAIFACVTGFVAVVQVILKNQFLVDDHTRPDGRKWYKYRKWLPNWVPIGMAFVLPATHYSTATLIGALTSYIWAKKSPWSHGMYCYAVAAGFIAGEGLGGVVQAVLEISGVSGSRYGTSIGCPGDDCY